jgi:TfoX/Sxy family transcriptional regulator of competence genes
MSASEQLIRRVRESLETVSHVKEKKMFSGITFMVDGKMCINVVTGHLMIRIDPVLFEELIEKPACTPVVMKGRELKGFVYVDEHVLKTKKHLEYWIGLALEFNPRAKVSKQKRTGKRPGSL